MSATHPIVNPRPRSMRRGTGKPAGSVANMPRDKKDPADRREEILVATLDLIIASGVERLRATDVAERLGVSSGLIFYHFDTIENLIVRAFEFAAERDLARLDAVLAAADGTIESRLRTVLREYGPTGKASGWRLWIESWSASLHEPALRKVVAGLDARWREVVTELIAEGVAAGVFTSPDPRGSAWRLTALIDGLAVQDVALDSTVTDAQIADWVESALRLELGT